MAASGPKEMRRWPVWKELFQRLATPQQHGSLGHCALEAVELHLAFVAELPNLGGDPAPGSSLQVFLE